MIIALEILLGREAAAEFSEGVQEIPTINWSWFRNLQDRLELTQET